MSSRPQARPQPAACHDEALSGFLSVLRITRPDADAGLIRRAYQVAEFWHEGQTRMSGHPYITHPLAVAVILAEVGADDETLCAALLHDTIEDTPYTPTELRSEFGAGVAALVAGVSALDQAKDRRGRIAARVIATAKSSDIRVLKLKLADRLHNMRTVQFIAQAKQLRKARESLDIFVPAASELRLNAIEAELKTLAQATLQRNRHAGSASGRLLVAVTALLPATARTRWREEWLGELHTLPAPHDRASFALHTAFGIPRLALTARASARQSRRPG